MLSDTLRLLLHLPVRTSLYKSLRLSIAPLCYNNYSTISDYWLFLVDLQFNKLAFI